MLIRSSHRWHSSLSHLSESWHRHRWYRPITFLPRPHTGNSRFLRNWYPERAWICFHRICTIRHKYQSKAFHPLSGQCRWPHRTKGLPHWNKPSGYTHHSPSMNHPLPLPFAAVLQYPQAPRTPTIHRWPLISLLFCAFDDDSNGAADRLSLHTTACPKIPDKIDQSHRKDNVAIHCPCTSAWPDCPRHCHTGRHKAAY